MLNRTQRYVESDKRYVESDKRYVESDKALCWIGQILEKKLLLSFQKLWRMSIVPHRFGVVKVVDLGITWARALIKNMLVANLNLINLLD